MAAKQPTSKRTTSGAKGGTKAKGKSNAGRPTKYPETQKEREALCEYVIALGSEGKTPVQIACALQVSRQTLYNWGDEHPEFLAALTRAKEEEQAHMERLGYQGMHSKDFNAAVWKTSMQARFRDEYTERRKVDHGVQDSLANLMSELDGKNGRIPNG